MRKAEDTQKLTRDAQLATFQATYGTDPGSVAAMFQDGNVLHSVLEHMYLDAMDELRQCDIPSEGIGIQAQAQLLWTLLNLPLEIEAMNTVSTE